MTDPKNAFQVGSDATPKVGPDEGAREGGYCGRTFVYRRTANRPPAYCPDRTYDEAPRTCQARARAQRMANRAAGLQMPLQTQRQDVAEIQPAIESLIERLDQYVEHRAV